VRAPSPFTVASRGKELVENRLVGERAGLLTTVYPVRKLSYGTRTDVGSRVIALLASVIDTCRQRGHSPWPSLQTAIADRCAGRPLAPLPQ
jgi:hypothetical protein